MIKPGAHPEGDFCHWPKEEVPEQIKYKSSQGTGVKQGSISFLPKEAGIPHFLRGFKFSDCFSEASRQIG